ncbi:DUF5719 family protein [Demequina globuliformis]|uniref:DUF5719 family protein n=1 Tax=Demequina globuliformis TaxID=676202 RepID=UPI000783405C|nr:DUF5719 family protein [Demequina globuliformis]
MKWTAAIPVALAVGAVVAASTVSVPAAHEGSVPVITTVAVEPSNQPAVCPGPLEVPVGEISSGDDALDSSSEDRTLWVSPDPSGEVGDGDLVDATVATSMERVGGGDIASLAGTTCTPPRQDQWIVAGSTAVGSSARLVLSNPSEATVRVTVSLFGPVSVDGRESFTTAVGAGAQETVLLESVEPELPALAVRVQAGGVGIATALQDSRLDGFVAAGTDWATASASGTDLLVPIAGPSSTQQPASLRLVAPEDAQVSLSMWGESGTREWLDGQTLDLEAGLVTDVTVPAGEWGAVRVESDTPVSAAALTRSGYELGEDALPAADLAWTPAQAVGNATPRAVVVPEGDVTVVATAPEGTALTLTDTAGDVLVDETVHGEYVHAFALSVPAGTVLRSDSHATWALHVRDGGFITTLTPRPVERVAQEVAIEPGTYVN